MSTAESDRCGYRLEIGLDDQDIAAGPCDRPVWEDRDRCLWHAPVDGKTREQLERADPAGLDTVHGAYLREASLANADWFAGASLVGADLTGADAKGADFSDADLTLATLTDLSAIGADFSDANLEGAILTNADVRRATLEGARLHETVLTDMHIGGGTKMGRVAIYDQEDAPPDLIDEQPLEAAAWVYRQLQALYEENALPELARRSYHMERDARRRLAWRERDFVAATKWELSRWVMQYGSSPYRVLFASLVVIVVCALLFPLTGGIQETQAGETITYAIQNPEDAPWWWLGDVLFKSLYFSVVTFATLGLGDIQPIGPFARFLAGLESILGSLLAALLVFVLARLVTW
ncbi:pentapeptide repeat-containing protein [Halorussus sp. AFM4]|uniref:pentapeptide repeat-containing protein n=1 Tax=Halorussus sp. AFM4 TaxID=3421651 RepID=UPI003EBA5129